MHNHQVKRASSTASQSVWIGFRSCPITVDDVVDVYGVAIAGNRVGMLNAVHMAANMVHMRTGALADVLPLPPNGPETSALPTFNSLANIVAHCVVAHFGCAELFDATTPPGGSRPPTVLQAVANIAKYRGSMSTSCSRCPSSSGSMYQRSRRSRTRGRCSRSSPAASQAARTRTIS